MGITESLRGKQTRRAPGNVRASSPDKCTAICCDPIMHTQAEVAWAGASNAWPWPRPPRGSLARPDGDGLACEHQTQPSLAGQSVAAEERSREKKTEDTACPSPSPPPNVTVHVLETRVFSHVDPSVRMPFLPWFIGLTSIVLQNSAQHHLL